jgi:gliding motility-associated-like protein
MGRILITLLLLIFCISISKSQCPDLPNNTTVDGSSSTTIEMCGAMSALFEVNDALLPTGAIDWYSSSTSGFDPLTTGTLIGSSSIDSADPCDAGGCPSIEAIFIDACGPGDESLNEFMVIGSGSGFSIDDLSVTFDMNNTFGGAGNGNINVGGICGWQDGNLALLSGCSTLIAVGPGDYIPPNSAVIIQTSSFGNTIYDVSSLCGVSECIYVVTNTCDRNVGAFSNCGGGTSGGSTRTNEIALTCGCSDVLIYDILDPQFVDVCTNQGGNGMHVLSDLTYANNVCNNGPIINTIPQFSYSAVISTFNHSFTDAECNTTQYVVGVLNSTQFNSDCCMEQITEEYAFDIACIEAELQGNADLCPGECAEISVLITGGVSPYDLDLSITGLPFPFNNISLPFIGFPLDDKITICFDNGGPLIDDETFTVDVPAIAAGFSGSLVLNSISDDNGCVGTINGNSISVSFTDDPDIINPGEQQACDIGDGTGIFILADLNNIINGGTGATVNYYSDAGGTMPISDPYITTGGSIYAQVLGTPCNSEIIEIPLVVITNGDAGVVSLFCDDPINGLSTECNICDDDGVVGEEITLTIIFENPLLNYNYEVVWTAESGPSSTIVGSGVGMSTFNFTVVENMTFAVIVVTADGDCPDMTDLGDIVIINYSLQPDLDEPQDLTACGSVVLPDITGNVVPSNAAYFTEPGGMGTMYNPGDIISANTTLYLFAGIEDCDVEYSFEVIIEEEAIIDDPDDVVSCGVYSLPDITGTNIDNVSYFTEIDGGGNMVTSGTIISTSTILYLFDTNCGGNQPILDITITPGPIIQNETDTIVCEMYIVEPIVGIDLSGNEAYYDTISGGGTIINVGDTITTDSILFIYDNTGGCEVEVPVFIDIRQLAFPGLDTAIIICEGNPTLVNINEELGGELPDSIGLWFDVNSTGVIIDSSQVDFSSLTTGIYLFEYQIMDSICVDTHSVLTVNIIGIPNAGDDASLTLCNDTMGIDVFSLLGNPDINGLFYDELNMIASFDPMNASFTASTSGTTTFTYVVGNPVSSCGADSSIFSVIVEESINAGDDILTSACAGNIIDLETLLTNNSTIGIFEEITPSGGLMGSIFDTEEVADGSYPIYHIIQGNGSCPSDTALLTLEVTDAANAGDENEIGICGDTSVSLTDYINGDEGGQFYFNNALLPSGDIVFTNEVGSFDYLYIVGDGIECPFDTATLTIIREQKPPTFLNIDITNLCNDDCTTVSFTAANNGGQTIILYYHIESNTGEVVNGVQQIGDLMPDTEITYCIDPGELSNNELQPGTEYTFILDSLSLDDPNCIFIDGTSVTFNTFVSVEGELTGSYCLDSEVIVGGDIYDKDTPSGTTIITNGSQNGCDSIIIVDLVFQDVAEGIFLENLCEGDSITVNNVLYTETNTTDEFTIPNGSINGCDSLVKINVVFFESSMGAYDDIICAGDTVMVNNEPYFEGNETGTQILEGLNSIGCDSIVEVSIEIEDVVISNFSEDFCSSYFIDINGTTYDQNNPSGIELFSNQAVNGCDSIVIIDLTFNAENIDSSYNVSTCDDSFTVTIGTSTFDVMNTSGTVELISNDPSACDTIIEVNLLFGELFVDYTELDGGCTATQTGTVIIESSTGDAPYNILYNGNNTIAFALPINLDLPVGTGEISITDDSGCESLIPYELFPGGGEAFDISLNQGQITVSGGDIDSIVWSPSTGLSCTDCIDPIADPDVTTNYNATIFFDDSCSVDLQIEIEIIDDTPDYIFPSVFSPNEDNINDNFIITITKGAIGIPQNMTIYDRWSNKVFTGSGIDLTTIGWNGMYKNKNVAPGVYVYVMTVLEDDKLLSIYGDITVIR